MRLCRQCENNKMMAEKIAMFNGICWWSPCLRHRIIALFRGEPRFRLESMPVQAI